MNSPLVPVSDRFKNSSHRRAESWRTYYWANEYRVIEDLRNNIANFVEQYYNRQRPHSASGYQVPEQFEAMLIQAASTGDGVEFSEA